MGWKGLSENPSSKEKSLEGDSVGLFARYPCNTRCFRGHPLQSTQLSPMSYQIPAWVKGRAYLTQNFKKIMIWLVWIMIIAGAFISVNSEQTL